MFNKCHKMHPEGCQPLEKSYTKFNISPKNKVQQQDENLAETVDTMKYLEKLIHNLRLQGDANRMDIVLLNCLSKLWRQQKNENQYSWTLKIGWAKYLF